MTVLERMPLRDIGLAIFIVASWGIHSSIIKIGVQELQPLTLLALRFFFTALVFLPCIKPVPQQAWPLFLGFIATHYIGHLGFLFLALDSVVTRL